MKQMNGFNLFLKNKRVHKMKETTCTPLKAYFILGMYKLYITEKNQYDDYIRALSDFQKKLNQISN